MTTKEKIIAALGAFAVKARRAETNDEVMELVSQTAFDLVKILKAESEVKE